MSTNVYYNADFISFLSPLLKAISHFIVYNTHVDCNHFIVIIIANIVTILIKMAIIKS